MKIILFQHSVWWLKGKTTLKTILRLYYSLLYVQCMIMSYCHRRSWATWECKLGAYDNFPKIQLLAAGPGSNHSPSSNTAMVSLLTSVCFHTNHVSVALFGSKVRPVSLLKCIFPASSDFIDALNAALLASTVLCDPKTFICEWWKTL